MSTYRCKIGTSDGRVLEKEFEADSRAALQVSLEERVSLYLKFARLLCNGLAKAPEVGV